MFKTKFVSVVIPTLNRPEMTYQAFLSVQNQTYTDIETIIVDNGSSGMNLQKMKDFNLDFISCTTLGAGAARKAGIKASSGQFILFLDSDDLLEPYAISVLVDGIHEELDGAFGLITNLVNADIELINQEQLFLAPLATNTLLRKNIFNKYGEFDNDNFSWPRWLIRAQEDGLNLGKIPQLVAKRVVHGGNLSLDGNSMEFYFNEISRKLRNKREGQSGA